MRKGPRNFPSPRSLHSLLCHLCFSYSCSCKSLSTAAQLVSPPPLATPLAEACSIWRALATAFTLFASHLPPVVAVAASCCCFYFCCCCCCWWPTGLSTLCAFVCPTHKRPAKQAGKGSGKWGWQVERGARTCNLIF